MSASIPDDPAKLYDWASTLATEDCIDPTDEDHPMGAFANGLLEWTVGDRRNELGVSVSKHFRFDASDVDYDQLQGCDTGDEWADRMVW